MQTAATPPAAGYADREPTKPPDWHQLVVWDVFFNALTTGLFLVAAVGELALPEVFGPVAVWAYPAAFVLLLVDLSLLVLDLGDPLRFHHMLRVFKLSSPMSLGTWCLTAYSLPLTLLVAIDIGTVVGLVPGDSDAVWWVRRVLLIAGLPVAFGSAAYKGVLFSTSAQPGWRDSRWLGGYHTSSAVVFGCAELLVLSVLTGHDRAAALLRPALGLLLVLGLIPLGLLLGELRPELTRRYTRDDLFRGVALSVGGGVLIPLLALAAVGTNPFAVVLTAVLVLTGGWVIRHLIVMLPHQAPLVR
ncbi:MAG: Polysulfide reductase, NrfD [Gemmataceae bacterium]|nr:Polysulfide reductase, NrfD [Gemmataceae bacterium]